MMKTMGRIDNNKFLLQKDFWVFNFNRFRPQTMRPNKSPIQSGIDERWATLRRRERKQLFSVSGRVYKSFDNMIFSDAVTNSVIIL